MTVWTGTIEGLKGQVTLELNADSQLPPNGERGAKIPPEVRKALEKCRKVQLTGHSGCRFEGTSGHYHQADKPVAAGSLPVPLKGNLSWIPSTERDTSKLPASKGGGSSKWETALREAMSLINQKNGKLTKADLEGLNSTLALLDKPKVRDVNKLSIEELKAILKEREALESK